MCLRVCVWLERVQAWQRMLGTCAQVGKGVGTWAEEHGGAVADVRACVCGMNNTEGW